MDKYLVIGNPIAHSLSPQIHAEFAKQTHQVLTYDRLCVEPENFFSTLDSFFASGGKGANITAPFKSMAFEYTQSRCSERAQLAKAVNTLYLNPHDNKVWGDNTDGIGLLRDLKKHDWDISGKKLLILGAGGAIRGILPALLSENPESITLYNRTAAKANTLTHEFQGLKLLNINKIEKYDCIINSIPSTHIPQAEFWSWLPTHLTALTCAYDLNYSREENMRTPFMVKIKSLDCKHALDGIGMLIEQAAESFFIWRGVRPKISI